MGSKYKPMPSPYYEQNSPAAKISRAAGSKVLVRVETHINVDTGVKWGTAFITDTDGEVRSFSEPASVFPTDMLITKVAILYG